MSPSPRSCLHHLHHSATVSPRLSHVFTNTNGKHFLLVVVFGGVCHQCHPLQPVLPALGVWHTRSTTLNYLYFREELFGGCGPPLPCSITITKTLLTKNIIQDNTSLPLFCFLFKTTRNSLKIWQFTCITVLMSFLHKISHE